LESQSSTRDFKLGAKLVRHLKILKRRMDASHVLELQKFYFPNAETSEHITKLLDPSKTNKDKSNFERKKQYQPATIIYLKTLIFTFFMSKKEYALAEPLSLELIKMVESYNKWNLDHLWGFIFYQYARVGEKLGKLNEIRPKLFSLYKLSSNSKNESSQAVLLNLILRNYIETNNFSSASDFLQNTLFPESKQNNEFIKYLFYSAKIKAIQSEYQEAFTRVTQALKKAPEKGVLGFKLSTQKLAIVCEMLMGDVPSRTIFSHSNLKSYLFPYYELVHSLVKGDIVGFENVKNKHTAAFKKDGLMILINRLYQNVVRAGLKKINLSYSQISFDDIRQKLNLGESLDVGLIIAKALKDGVISGEINSAERVLVIKEKSDVYSTNDPQINYQKRISYCMNLHDAAVKALTYPNEKDKKKEEEEEEDDEDDLLQDLMGDDMFF